MTTTVRGSVAEVSWYFLRLGVIAFGGPAAHIAIMRRELARERHWTTDQELVDMLGVTNLIPGPNSTEMAMHLGATRAGWRGLWAAGFCFILPATALTIALAWAYVRYGATPAGAGIILGVQPFMLAIIAQAVWGLRPAALKGVETFVLVFVVAFAAAAGVGEVPLIFGAGFAMLAMHTAVRLLTAQSRKNLQPLPNPRKGGKKGPFRRNFAVAPVALAASGTPGVSAWELFLVFLKIGALLYGSGYVLLSFMQTEFVDHRGWLTQAQLVDAISAGQFTPGPVFSTAGFAGYVIDGWRGAVVATLGIFLPSFVFVTATHPLVPRLRRSPWAAPFLDGVNAAALALMAVVTLRLAFEVLDGWYTAGLFAAAVAVLLRLNPNSAWLVIAGVGAGLLHAVFA
ncbi:MAG: chromate efflux transporter [Dehalococcoidia bacterium]|uniref:chromate efflux transporter n=1 Tax=Candidatus Amarobacter glycogenicus TaxID=3140699 RepID=UPI0031370B9A|nr:chromate efflux transporter [Dehalococcoidia bacterium]MBK7330508.1 chromate efflux transporter [Dehalococcoidia bacterium]MBK8560688.1 chromate efflux transporter [Dehalococcoidia bacterium]